MDRAGGRILPAVFLISSGILVTTIVGALVIPNLLSVLVLLSLMASVRWIAAACASCTSRRCTR